MRQSQQDDLFEPMLKALEAVYAVAHAATIKDFSTKEERQKRNSAVQTAGKVLQQVRKVETDVVIS